MKEGHFGLTFSNDPSFAFSVIPCIDSLFGVPDEEWDTVLDKVGDKILTSQTRIHNKIHKELVGDISDTGKLYQQIVRSGYNQDIHGNVGCYLSHIMAVYINKNENKPKIVYHRI